MHPIRCAYQDEADYWRIRQFLRQVSLLNDRDQKPLLPTRLSPLEIFSRAYASPPLEPAIAGFHPPAGYTLRALGDECELPARSWLSWKAFHPDEPDEKYQGWEWYRNVQRVPLYRRDLDLLAVAPHGELAAFCTVWFDDVTRTAVFEPVGTHPAHQKRGLGKALMTEGLRRAQRLGATLATVSSYGKAAHMHPWALPNLIYWNPGSGSGD
jgi:GNAT superfamily N-acetyltransferase